MIKTFHHNKFSSVPELLEIKKEKKSRISVVLPALNEAATIGQIITAIRSELIDKYDFVDELIVVDGQSEDETSRIASECGASVYNVEEIGPQVLSYGKGTALWKSQFVLDKPSSCSDIVIFIDSDIIGFNHWLVTGLAGPLLLDDNLVFTKAFYNRPLILDSQLHEKQGGRVTEILVRPLICALIPELA
ncbi:MAG: glycosyltransferase, partial [Fibrobacter sp.]|nr:glycosyltransferase [Fibrobacter sp.]